MPDDLTDLLLVSQLTLPLSTIAACRKKQTRLAQKHFFTIDVVRRKRCMGRLRDGRTMIAHLTVRQSREETALDRRSGRILRAITPRAPLICLLSFTHNSPPERMLNFASSICIMSL